MENLHTPIYQKRNRKKWTVSSDLRLLGRVVLAMSTRTGKQDCYLNEFLKVKYFDDLIKVAHDLADVDKQKIWLNSMNHQKDKKLDDC